MIFLDAQSLDAVPPKNPIRLNFGSISKLFRYACLKFTRLCQVLRGGSTSCDLLKSGLPNQRLHHPAMEEIQYGVGDLIFYDHGAA